MVFHRPTCLDFPDTTGLREFAGACLRHPSAEVRARATRLHARLTAAGGEHLSMLTELLRDGAMRDYVELRRLS